MERFGLLVGVCLLLANVATAVPTVTVGQMLDGHALPGTAGGDWLAASAGVRDARRSPLRYEPFWLSLGLATEARQEAVGGGFLWASRASCVEENTHPWPLSTVLMRAADGYGIGEGRWQTLGMGASLPTSGDGYAVAGLGSDLASAQTGRIEAAELSLGEHIFGVVLTMGRLSVEKAAVLNPRLARGESAISPTEQPGNLGLATPPPGAVVLGSLGLGLLGWLRKRTAWQLPAQ